MRQSEPTQLVSQKATVLPHVTACFLHPDLHVKDSKRADKDGDGPVSGLLQVSSPQGPLTTQVPRADARRCFRRRSVFNRKIFSSFMRVVHLHEGCPCNLPFLILFISFHPGPLAWCHDSFQGIPTSCAVPTAPCSVHAEDAPPA